MRVDESQHLAAALEALEDDSAAGFLRYADAMTSWAMLRGKTIDSPSLAIAAAKWRGLRRRADNTAWAAAAIAQRRREHEEFLVDAAALKALV